MRNYFFGVSKIHQGYTWPLGAFDDFNSINLINFFNKKGVFLNKNIVKLVLIIKMLNGQLFQFCFQFWTQLDAV